jgi:hypothetical protein
MLGSVSKPVQTCPTLARALDQLPVVTGVTVLVGS